ncbi:MAG TPA: SH3 domain-containing protein [Rhizomicrobium sp.]|jgi:SH3-like domain-containing protein
MGFALVRRCQALVLLLIFGCAPALAADQVAFAPHYASLSREKVYLRQGPDYRYRVLWEYHRKGYPVHVMATYDAWRRVSDADGAVGWVHQTMLSDTRTVLITGIGRATARLGPSAGTPAVALLEPGVVAKLRACQPQVCKVEVDGAGGWVDKTRLWGVNAGEIFE